MRFILHLCNSLSTLKNANIMVIHRLTHIFHRMKPMKKREFSIFSELSTGNGFIGKIPRMRHRTIVQYARRNSKNGVFRKFRRRGNIYR